MGSGKMTKLMDRVLSPLRMEILIKGSFRREEFQEKGKKLPSHISIRAILKMER